MVFTAGCWLRLPSWKTCAVRKQQRLGKELFFFLLRMACELFSRKKRAGIRQLMTRTLVAVTSVGVGLSFVNPCQQKTIPCNSAALTCFKELSQPFSLASERKCWMSSKVQLQRQRRHLWAAVSNVGSDAGEFTKSVFYVYVFQ